jgi:copper homeostasis protein
MSIQFEVPVFNTESALLASRAGADRLELCSSFAEGGETPGAGMLSYLKQKVNIPVFVMIRPRGGNFVYSSDEIEVMACEIHALSEAGADGFVFGILDANNRIFREACRELIQVSGNKPCTFHRAFDACRNAEEALETVIESGFRRVLTSGMRANIDEGLDTVIKLLNLAGNRIIVLPGGGLKPEHLPPLMETGMLSEIHASCKAWDREKEIPVFDPSVYYKFRSELDR